MNTTYNTLFYFGSTAIDELYMNYAGLDQDFLDVVSTYGKGYQNYPGSRRRKTGFFYR